MNEDIINQIEPLSRLNLDLHIIFMASLGVALIGLLYLGIQSAWAKKIWWIWWMVVLALGAYAGMAKAEESKMSKGGWRVASDEESKPFTEVVTTRDYLASQALIGLLMNPPWNGLTSNDPKAYSKLSYKFADAMIDERRAI